MGRCGVIEVENELLERTVLASYRIDPKLPHSASDCYHSRSATCECCGTPKNQKLELSDVWHTMKPAHAGGCSPLLGL